jgi:hypothetical protein
VTGGSLRGLLYGLSRLMQDYLQLAPQLALQLHKQHQSAASDNNQEHVLVDVTHVPEYAVRGHRINYLEISNTYDAWSLTDLDQYVRYVHESLLLYLFIYLIYLFIYLIYLFIYRYFFISS